MTANQQTIMIRRVRQLQKETSERVRPQNFYWSSWPCSDFFSSRPLPAYFISIELHRPSWKRESDSTRTAFPTSPEPHFSSRQSNYHRFTSAGIDFCFSIAVPTEMATRLGKPRPGNTKPLHYIFRGLITGDADGSVISGDNSGEFISKLLLLNKIHPFRGGGCLDSTYLWTIVNKVL